MIHTSATVCYVEGKFHAYIETRFQSLPSLPSQRVNLFTLECASEAHAKSVARAVNNPNTPIE